MQVQSLGWEDPLEKGMATHSIILAWRIPWTEEPGGLQSTGSQRVKHDRDWAANQNHGPLPDPRDIREQKWTLDLHASSGCNIISSPVNSLPHTIGMKIKEMKIRKILVKQCVANSERPINIKCFCYCHLFTPTWTLPDASTNKLILLIIF